VAALPEEAVANKRYQDMTFKPGVSGNPSGRPKEIPEVRDLARAHTEAAIKRLAQIMKSDDDPRASAAAATALLDRGWGKPSQPIAGDDESPLRLIARIERVVVESAEQLSFVRSQDESNNRAD
jgi:hypothetical protein